MLVAVPDSLAPGYRVEVKLHTPISVAAQAKVNLTLAVGGPRPPKGYHPICSHFHCVDLADDVTISPLPERPAGHITLDVAWAADALRPSPIDWPAEKDLAVRAAAAATLRLGITHGLHLTVRKRIPTGGGLGGGSANAGAVLRLLHSVTMQAGNVPAAESGQWMTEVGSLLGSDVPFFADPVGIEGDIAPRPAVVEGYGEQLRRIERTHGWLVLILPPVACPTPAVYREFDAGLPGTGGQGPKEPDADRVFAAVSALLGRTISGELLFNDLAEPAMRVAPQLRLIAAEAGRITGQSVHVSGSGSTLFVAAGADRAAAAKAADRVLRGTGHPAIAVRLV